MNESGAKEKLINELTQMKEEYIVESCSELCLPNDDGVEFEENDNYCILMDYIIEYIKSDVKCWE